MAYKQEKDMYPDVVAWLERFLNEKFSKKRIVVKDTSRQRLVRALDELGLAPTNKPEWPTFDIYVDVAGFIITGETVEFAFVECKIKPISLRDISQLLGYSRVALPVYSCILAPQGSSGSVVSLLQTFKRYDILQYDWPKGAMPRSIVVATWNDKSGDIDYSSLQPPGHHFHTSRNTPK